MIEEYRAIPQGQRPQLMSFLGRQLPRCLSMHSVKVGTRNRMQNNPTRRIVSINSTSFHVPRLIVLAPDSVFSGWTEKSSRTESSWGSVIDASTLSSGTSCIVQPLSPTSFVTQSTEVTVSPRDSIKAEEQIATIVRITAAGTMPVEVQNVPDSPSKKCVPRIPKSK